MESVARLLQKCVAWSEKLRTYVFIQLDVQLIIVSSCCFLRSIPCLHTLVLLLDYYNLRFCRQSETFASSTTTIIETCPFHGLQAFADPSIGEATLPCGDLQLISRSAGRTKTYRAEL